MTPWPPCLLTLPTAGARLTSIQHPINPNDYLDSNLLKRLSLASGANMVGHRSWPGLTNLKRFLTTLLPPIRQTIAWAVSKPFEFFSFPERQHQATENAKEELG